MKKYLSLLFFVFHFSFFTLQAQSHIVDSLKRLTATQKEDTNKVKTLNLISGYSFRAGNYDSSLIYANRAKVLAEQLKFDRGLVSAYSNLGNTTSNMGNYSQGMQYTMKALEMSKKIGYIKGICNGYDNMGTDYTALENFPKALEYLQDELIVCRQVGNKRGICSSLGNMGTVYEKQGNYTKALEYYFQVLEISKETKDKIVSSVVQGYIGDIYQLQGNDKKALEYDTNALKINREIGFTDGIANNYEDMGRVYEHEGDYAKAREYVSKALFILKGIDRIGVASSYNAMGEIYSKEKMYPIAKEYFDSAFFVSKQSGSKENMRDVYYSFSKLDSAEGEFKKSVEDYKNYLVYRDSLVNEKTVKSEMSYAFDRKTDSAKVMQDKADALAAKEGQGQKVIRNIFIGGFSFAFLASGLFFFQRRRIAKEKRRSDELLLNILPAETAEELKETGRAKAKNFEMVTVMFTDFKDFTKISENLSPAELVSELHFLFQAYDNIIHKHNIEKIKTIGDSYLAAGGLPVPGHTHAMDVVNAALEIQQFTAKHNNKRMAENKPVFEARIGINTGPVVAGIVGIRKFAYDIWGDTVNLASRVESNGEVGKVNISGNTYELVKNNFNCTYRGKINDKSKGEVDMYFVECTRKESI